MKMITGKYKEDKHMGEIGKNDECGMIHIDLGQNEILLNISKNGKKQYITLRMVREIWHDITDGNRADIEYINAEICGVYIVCCASVSQGQGGIVFIWDTEQQKIVHCSDGRFAVKATVRFDKVYVLREISHWGVPAHLELDYCDFGTMSEGCNVTPIELDKITSETLANSPADYTIDFDGNAPVIGIKAKNKKYKLIGKDGKAYYSEDKGKLGGHRKSKIYGKLDCPSANRYIAKGQYVQHRVFFADEETAIAAGYRPCAVCMKEQYLLWKSRQGGKK